MRYDEAVRSLLTLGQELAVPRHARTQKFDLDNIRTLAAAMGHPERRLPCVHIAGTNGKGSVAAMLDSILRAAGLRTGLYTSPHLVRINERIRIEGRELPDAEFAAAFARLRAVIEALLARGAEAGGLRAHPTYFECLTAMALDCFARTGLDFAVYEVGMGGRLDATNIVTPEVAVLTQIDFDHEDYLGYTLSAIAAEKAGIIKPGAWVVSAAKRPEARAVISERVAAMGGRLVEIDAAYRVEAAPAAAEPVAQHAVVRAADGTRYELTVPLPGQFQVRNAVTALAAARLLAERGFLIPDDAIVRGIATVHWPGRLQRVGTNPTVYIDGTHNPAGAQELVAFCRQYLSGRRLWLVYGAMRDKAVEEITGLIFPLAWRVVLTAPQQPRAISPDVLAAMTRHLEPPGGITVVANPADALEQALSESAAADVVLATGSLYLAGDLLAYWQSGREAPAMPARLSRADGCG
ncbi:MAG: bifunctional folylpolyglutamate synthase/dihydrofolate synthase [Firmicutes bacterium]|nr:bifunctional folylpolyglutamate synthase/dihydrofolate synthase [Bacillota bacterium]